jgi:dipeptidyl aminopeptidase/acylaminoacyl peptidase
MKKSVVFLFIAILTVILSGCTNTVIFDTGNNLKLNYVVPSVSQPPNGYPAIVFIHGFGGSKDKMMSIVSAAADRGYFAIAIDWRAPDGASVMWPDQIDDAKNAIAWLTKDLSHAGNWSQPNPYRIDPSRIGAMGFSGGGLIALSLGLDENVKAVASFAGPTNLESIYRYLSFNEKEDERDLDPSSSRSEIIDFTEALLGPYEREDINNDGVADYDPDYFDASPINHTQAGVPLLLIHGSRDNVVPPSQSRNLMTKMRSLGGVCDLIIYKCGHNLYSSLYPGLANERNPEEPMDVNSGIAYSEEDTGLDAMFMFFDAKL